jgi:DNA-directed RNA polymerase subunit E'/Rpb7
MDPLFERRSMVKKVHIASRFLQKNIQSALLARLKMIYEGKCIFEGFIQQDSIMIVKYSLGRINMLQGGVDYNVEFQCDICMPHAGQTLRANTILKSKVGVHAEMSPVKVLIPRDLHIGVEEFDKIEIGDTIEFEVVGAQFRQQDKDIIVVGRLKSTIEAGPLMPLLTSQTSQPTIVGDNGTGSPEEKTITISAPAEERPKRKLKRKTVDTSNEPNTERMVEGTT